MSSNSFIFYRKNALTGFGSLYENQTKIKLKRVHLFLPPAGILNWLENLSCCLPKRRKERMGRKSVNNFSAHSSSMVPLSEYFLLFHVTDMIICHFYAITLYGLYKKKWKKK
jgi:hypothetical protein